MAIWLIGGVASSAYVINNTISNTERAGTLLGTGLGASIILTLWVIGDVILGLFVLLTRPKSIILLMPVLQQAFLFIS